MTRASDGPAPARVLVVDADPALLDLLEQWLDEEGCGIVQESAGSRLSQEPVDLIIVDVPFPRHGRIEVLKRISNEYPGVPILALSANFFAGIEANGAVARSLGVAGALPKPVTHDALLAAVRKLLPAAA